VPRAVGAAAQAVLDARGEAGKLPRIFERSFVPMVMVDSSRRYVEVNASARLWFRLSLQEMRTRAIGDITPAPRNELLEQAWARLIDGGCAAGRCPVHGGNGSQLDVVYHGVAHVLPGLHLIAFAPASWTEQELDEIDDDRPGGSASLTRRELELLRLAADGLDGPGLAENLSVSRSTVRTHFENIYAKLSVHNRAAAVAKAMRLGLIE
jgi:ATP/maltotriose-dependent transcriptional regulator MalT